MTAHYSLGNSILCVDYQIRAKELLQTVFYLLCKYVQRVSKYLHKPPNVHMVPSLEFVKK